MKNDDDIPISPTLPTRYSHEASIIVKSIFKNIHFTILVILVLVSFTIMDLLLDFGLKLPISDMIIDSGVIFTAFTLLFVLILTIRPLYKSQKLLNNWGDLFEKNSIMAEMILSMNDRTKEEALSAICEVINQIGRPLQEFLTKNNNYNDIFNVTINTNDNQNIFFDLLIDSHLIKSNTDPDLKNIIEGYGSIVVKITDQIDTKTVDLFKNDISSYLKEGHKLGLAMIIGESVDTNCYQYVNESNEKILKNLILVEKTRPAIKNTN